MKKTWPVLLLFMVIKVLLQVLAIHPVYELHRDEFLHIDLGKHLDWGYLTVPPLTGLISRFILMLGGSVFWVKLFPVITGMLLLYLVWETVGLLKGGIWAKMVALSGVTFSVLVRINTLYQPNSTDFLMWTLIFYLLVNYLVNRQPRWLYLTGIALAVGFLNKYNICFLMAGLLPAILLSRLRTVFLSRHLYLAAALALVLVLPNLAWQFHNGFPILHHMRELATTQLANVSRLGFLRDQLFFFAGSLPVILLALAALLSDSASRKFSFICWTILFTLAIFFLLRAKSYYSIGLYPVLIALGSVYLEKLFPDGRKRWLMLTAMVLPPLLFIPVFRYAHPVLPPEEIIQQKAVFDTFGLNRWEDGQNHQLPQDFADMLGWKELAHLVDSAYQMLDEKQGTIVHCDNYGQAGAVNYYTQFREVSAYSMNADYINWYPLDRMEIRNVILVKEIRDNDVSREKEKPYFEEVRLVGEISHPWAREKGTKVWLLRNARISVRDILKKEIADRKQKMRMM